MKVNGKDPDYPVPTPVSKTGQQEAWHRAQTTFCRKYNNRNFEGSVSSKAVRADPLCTGKSSKSRVSNLR